MREELRLVSVVLVDCHAHGTMYSSCIADLVTRAHMLLEHTCIINTWVCTTVRIICMHDLARTRTGSRPVPVARVARESEW